MPRRKKTPESEAVSKEKANVFVKATDFDDAFDSLEDDAPHVRTDDQVESGNEDELDDVEIDERFRGSAAFMSLQRELSDIREARQKLSKDMEEPELDRDERDTLKARGTLLDSRERSAREELKLFHKNELSQLGQIRKVRIVIEDLLDDKGNKFEGAV